MRWPAHIVGCVPLRSTPPPPGVCADFGVLDRPVPLVGGQGGAWRVGPLVLKFVGRSAVTAEERRWLGTAVSSTPDIRVAAPVPASDGSWVVDGWGATAFLEGSPAGSRWDEVLAAGRALHASWTRLPRPSFLDRRRSPWDTGDRMAWGEEPLIVEVEGLRPLVERIAAELEPWTETDGGGRSQLVHGDLGGNVLLADGLAPAVIDLSPYWRPARWASAVVAVDALVWSDAEWSHFAGLGRQWLLRAMLYRLVTDDVFGRDTSGVNAPVAERILRSAP